MGWPLQAFIPYSALVARGVAISSYSIALCLSPALRELSSPDEQGKMCAIVLTPDADGKTPASPSDSAFTRLMSKLQELLKVREGGGGWRGKGEESGDVGKLVGFHERVTFCVAL